MTIQNTKPYKASEFDSTNLILFLIVAFGWTWIFNALFISGILQMPAGVGTPETDVSQLLPIIGILLVMPFGPTISGFIITARSRGREGVNELWKRFWSRRFTIAWLIIVLAFYPAYFWIAPLVLIVVQFVFVFYSNKIIARTGDWVKLRVIQ